MRLPLTVRTTSRFVHCFLFRFSNLLKLRFCATQRACAKSRKAVKMGMKNTFSLIRYFSYKKTHSVSHVSEEKCAKQRSDQWCPNTHTWLQRLASALFCKMPEKIIGSCLYALEASQQRVRIQTIIKTSPTSSTCCLKNTNMGGAKTFWPQAKHKVLAGVMNISNVWPCPLTLLAGHVLGLGLTKYGLLAKPWLGKHNLLPICLVPHTQKQHCPQSRKGDHCTSSEAGTSQPPHESIWDTRAALHWTRPPRSKFCHY